LQRLLRLFGMIPEAGFGDFFFEGGQSLAVAVEVKDSYARVRRACAARRSDVADLREAVS
jgi:hypothetical protein